MLASTAGVLLVRALNSTCSRVLQTWRFSGVVSRVSVGRSSNNDVVINSNVISRHHATFEKINDIWHLQSFGKNGCFINDRRVDLYPLSGETLIRLGQTGSHLLVAIEDEMPASRSSQATQDFTLTQNMFDTGEGTTTDTFESGQLPVDW